MSWVELGEWWAKKTLESKGFPFTVSDDDQDDKFEQMLAKAYTLAKGWLQGVELRAP